LKKDDIFGYRLAGLETDALDRRFHHVVQAGLGLGVGKVVGFSLYAGVTAKAHERQKLERLCGYISRPVVSN
jgi:hypothetical protein